jgi:hypothetical protein
MPYKVMMSGSKHAVFKVDDDGKPVGKPLGTHPNAADAKRQVAALYANEKKPKKEVDPVTYTATSGAPINVTVTGDTETKDYYDDEMMPVMTVSGPLTFADLMAEEEAQEQAEHMHDLTYKFQRLAANIMTSDVEDKAAALSDLATEYSNMMKECMAMEDKATAIAKQIAGDNQPVKEQPAEEVPETKSIFIWKEADTYRWLAAYSNNRRDEDNPPEIISSQSHKEFDESLQKGEWPMPELWLWHVEYPVGITQYHAYDSSTGFPVAAGIFYKDCDWAAEGVIQAEWDGVSHGMPREWIQRDEKDKSIIVRHRTKEITFLPQWAAANKLAFNIISKESTMEADNQEKGLPAHKRPEFIKAFGEERVEKMEAALNGKAKEADAAGTEQKEAQVIVTEDKPLTQADLLKALEFVSDGIKTVLGNLDTRLKAIEEAQVEEKDKFDIVEILKSKSIIGKESARVDGRSSLAKDAPKEAEQESYTQQAVGMRLSLVDQMIGANEAWYNGDKK